MPVSIKIQDGDGEKTVTLELKARKSLDHEEMDIVIMP